jgi:hypothetical protein
VALIAGISRHTHPAFSNRPLSSSTNEYSAWWASWLTIYRFTVSVAEGLTVKAAYPSCQANPRSKFSFVHVLESFFRSRIKPAHLQRAESILLPSGGPRYAPTTGYYLIALRAETTLVLEASSDEEEALLGECPGSCIRTRGLTSAYENW